MNKKLQFRHVLKHKVGECEYDVGGKVIVCHIVSKDFALAGSDGIGGVFVSEEVPNEPFDFRYPLAVHEYKENYMFWELNPDKHCPDDKDDAHTFAIEREIEAAESMGQVFLGKYLEFMLDLYDRYIEQAELRGNPTEREKGFRKIYAHKMSSLAV